MAGLILTLWSFLGVSGAMDAESELSGLLYVASAFGLLGLPQIVFGGALGLLVAGWASLISGPWAESLEVYREESKVDRRIAAAILTVPIVALLVGGIVGGVHTYVTSTFVRVGFQALGLTLAAAAATVSALAAAPLFFRIFERSLGRLPFVSGGRGRAVRTLLAAVIIGVVVATAGGYFYATGLNVWSSQTILMGIAASLLTPLFTFAMTRIPLDRIWWRWGLPISGIIAAVVCFGGAGSWTSSSATMRRAASSESALMAVEVRFLQKFADNDGDNYAAAFGGNDCDDTDPEIYPGAVDRPGDGVDQDCSGEDAEPPKGENHPSRKIVRRAYDAAEAAAVQKAKDIPEPPRNFVILLIDTLRYDHLGFGGYERDTSPHMDALAGESVVFQNHYATSPHTPRSIPAIFLSRYASHTSWWGAQYNYPKIRPKNLSVFEVLDEQGWHNVGVSSHFYFTERQGIRQGFDEWDNEGAGTISESNEDISAPRIWAKLEPKIEEIAATQQREDAEPYSLFIHFFEPHAQWIEHDEFDFGDGGSTRERHINNYDSEVAFVDSYVGRVIDKLKTTGLYENATIILTSDHGEGFNEHGYFFHGQTLYNEVIHVPLLIRVPGWYHRNVEAVTSLVDIAPTMLDLVDLPAQEAFQGESLVPLMVGKESTGDRVIYSELLPYTSWKEHHKAVIRGDDKYINVLSSGTKELYDLGDDPGEQQNIYDSEPEKAEEMQKLLEHFNQL